MEWFRVFNVIRSFVVVIYLLNVFDAFQTFFFINLGLASEHNPFMALVIGDFGWFVFFVLKLGVSGVLMVVL